MPRGSTSTAWFKDLFGFDETSSFSSNQAKFRMEGDELVCETSAFPRQYVGQWETPSLAELRERMAAASAAASGADKPLSFEHLATPVGVQSLIMDPQYAGAVFQAASQFNALEMTGPGVSPRQGVAIYANDPTQGPKCALSCPAATIFRNYLVEGEGGVLGQGDKQVDCLRDVGAVVGNGNDKFWTMKNGYALPATSGAIRELGERLNADATLVAKAEAQLRVGVHWDTQAKPPNQHRVCQVFASALPVAYAPNTRAAEWEPFARLVLRAAYEATLAVAVCKASSAGGGRVRVFLTALGGGAFGNRMEWIRDAVTESLHTFRSSPLDVVLVHYGSMVPSEWQAVSAPSAGAAAAADASTEPKQ